MDKVKRIGSFVKQNWIAILTAVVVGRFGYCVIDDHFDVTNKAAKLLGYFFVFLFIVMMSYVYLHRENIKDRLHKIYLVVGLVVGTMYLIIIPIFCVPDELFHFKDSYHVSNEMLGIHDPDVVTLTMREADNELDLNKNEYENPIVYAKYIRSVFSDIIITEKTNLIETDTGKNYGEDYLYVIPALGMTFGRLIHLGSVQMFLMGRFFNLLFFVSCIAYAIKRTPIGKLGFFGIGLLPIVLQQAASLSYDVMINGFSFVAIAITLALLDENTKEPVGEALKLKDYVLYAVSIGFLIPTKGYAYMLFGFLPLWVLTKNWLNSRGTSVKLFAKECTGRKLLYVMMGILLFNVLVAIVRSTAGSSGPAVNIFEPHIIEWCDVDGYYVDVLLHQRPDLRFQIVYKTIAIYFGEYWTEMFGMNLGWKNIDVPAVFIYIWFIWIAVLFMKRKQEKMLTTVADKTVMAGFTILTVCFVLAGILFGWTPMVYNFVVGAQGRYFLPVFALPLLIMRTKKIEIDEENDGDLVFWTLVLTALIVIYVYVAHDVKLNVE